MFETLLAALTQIAPDSVECSNCGSPWWQDLLSVGVALVGIVAIVISVRALRHSADMRDMMRVEHEAFIGEISRKPELEIKIHWMESEHGVRLERSGEHWSAVVFVAVKNVGEKWIENAVVNVILPASLWEHGGQPHRMHSHGGNLIDTATPTDEKLPIDGEPSVPAMYFSWTKQAYWPTVSVIHRFTLPLKPAHGNAIPVRVEITDTTGESWSQSQALYTLPPTGEN